MRERAAKYPAGGMERMISCGILLIPGDVVCFESPIYDDG
jgi:hypothetical protein